MAIQGDCGAGMVRAGLAGLFAVVRRGWRCWWQEEALWFVLVWGVLCWQVLRLGTLPGSHQLLLLAGARRALERRPQPSPAWRSHLSPLVPSRCPGLCQHGTWHLPLVSRQLESISAFI